MVLVGSRKGSWVFVEFVVPETFFCDHVVFWEMDMSNYPMVTTDLTTTFGRT